MQTGKNAYWGLILGLIIAGIFLFPNLGKFGMWEPGETRRAEIAEAYLDGSRTPQSTISEAHLEERLVALSWSLTDKSEFSARFPLAVLGLMALATLFFVVKQLSGPRVATLSVMAFVSAPVFLFHSKQLTSGMPALLAEILALGGLSLVAYAEERRVKIGGCCLAAVGIVVGSLSAGLLIGVAAPLISVVLALALDGKLGTIFRSTGPAIPKTTERLIFVAGALAIVAAGAYGALVLSPEDNLPLLTGGLIRNPGKPQSFDFVLEQIAYGWFPWSTLLPLIGIGLIGGQESALTEGQRSLRHLIVASLSVGYVCQTAQVHFFGPTPFFGALPITLSAGLVIAELEKQVVPWRLAALIAIAAFILVVRDFAQKPDVILMGHGVGHPKLPEGFMPIYQAALFSAVFGVMIVALGFFGARDDSNGKWKNWRSLIFPPLVALSFGGYISFSLVPELSLHWSSKHALDSYEQFKQGDEKLAIYNHKHFNKGAKKLQTADEAVAWLSDSARHFLLFPKKTLPPLNGKFREKNERNIFVLDAESSGLLLATSKPLPGEKNASPIAKFVGSSPFSPAPSHELDINFDNKLRLIGYDIKNSKGGKDLKRGDELTLSTYWRVDGQLSRDYDIFIHFDGPGGRFHGDHKPIDDGYPTSQWRPGDFIKDEYKRTVPLYQQTGTYRIKLGMYKGSSHRLPILDEPRAEENALFLTSVTLK